MSAAAKNALSAAAVAAVYYALARVGLELSLAGTASCPLWPASGFALVAAIALGPAAALGVFLGSWPANYQALPAAGLNPALACAAIALGSAAQALLGARVLGRTLTGPDPLSNSRDVLWFAGAAPLVCLTSATVGVGALAGAGLMPPALSAPAWLTWWIGDAVGVLIVAPLLFAWKPRATDEFGEPISPRRAFSFLSTVAVLYASIWLGFGERLRLGDSYPLSFLPFTALIWIALRLDARGATAGAAALAVLVHWYTLNGAGPFAAGHLLAESLILSSVYVALAALTAYLLRALLAERRDALAGLREARAALERRVSNQDADLWTAGATLRAAALGRVQDGQRIQLYRRIVGELPVGIAVLRLEDSGNPETWLIVEMNQIGQLLSGSRGEDPAGRRLLDFAPELRDSELTRACAEALRQNRGVEVQDYISTERVPGAHFSIKVFPLGAPLIGLAFENITARRAAEDALVRSQKSLEERTAELARSNTELTQFAYVASHDLQAPLRKASAFAEHLKRHLAGTLDETDKDFMMRLDRSLTGMQDLIDALLGLARVATHAEPHRAVDLALVAADVLGDLEEPLARANAKVRVDGLPVVMGDPNQMRQLLQNLIGNALKFRRPGRPPRILVTGRPLDGGRCELRIEDNGVGFDMKYADRIFQPFQRLHSAKEYPGTGMGLAICHKIVERHGGEIVADSAPERGASFTVVLPAGPPGEIECLSSSASKTTRTSRL